MKLLGIFTEDSELYFELVSVLRKRRIPFVSVDKPASIPEEVSVIITGAGEGSLFSEMEVVEVSEGVEECVDKALNLLWGKREYMEIVVGIDPGPRPGVAAVGDGLLLKSASLTSPEDVLPYLESLMRIYIGRSWKVRVGHGDPISLKRILASIPEGMVELEIVDESGTTSPGAKSDELSAIKIALKSGGRRGFKEYNPTEGEVQNVQRLSRLKSGGKITIDRGEARRVLKGEITIDEAVERKLNEITVVKNDTDK
ncbi:MAG: hypothetical protein J7L88_03860 [Thermoplasmata archaeon]|nr:hypothetical protein [Thermoplasmata archaeon]